MVTPVSSSAPDSRYLRPNRYFDLEHPLLVDYAREHARGSDPRELAISLYYAVRDGFRYSPWGVLFEDEAFVASAVLRRGLDSGALHCVDKATVLAACARIHGIPSRMHFANVRNHIGTASLEAKLGTDLLVYHGYCELWLEGRWVAATPAFNRGLCERLGVAPLEFDGREDSVFQEYDAQAGRFMEYVEDHGHHADIPVAAMTAAWRRYYPSVASTEKWPRPDSA